MSAAEIFPMVPLLFIQDYQNPFKTPLMVDQLTDNLVHNRLLFDQIFLLKGAAVIRIGCTCLSLLMVLAAGNACVPMSPRASSAKSIEAAQQCRANYSTAKLSGLEGKLVFDPDATNIFPTKEMMRNTTYPDEQQRKAIGRWESAIRGCKQLFSGVGMVTSATEDIIAKKRSTLRFGLYKGKLSFGAYNTGIVQTEIDLAGYQEEEAHAYQKGGQAGTQRAAQIQRDIQMIQMQNEINTFNANMNTHGYGQTYWKCTTSGYDINLRQTVTCY